MHKGGEFSRRPVDSGASVRTVIRITQSSSDTIRADGRSKCVMEIEVKEALKIKLLI